MNKSVTENYTCNLTARGWQLYSDMKGSEVAADVLSAALSHEVNEARRALRDEPCLSERKLAAKVRDRMNELLNKYAKFGAADTEPSCVLVAELERAFGLPQYSLERW